MHTSVEDAPLAVEFRRRPIADDYALLERIADLVGPVEAAALEVLGVELSEPPTTRLAQVVTRVLVGAAGFPWGTRVARSPVPKHPPDRP